MRLKTYEWYRGNDNTIVNYARLSAIRPTHDAAAPLIETDSDSNSELPAAKKSRLSSISPSPSGNVEDETSNPVTGSKSISDILTQPLAGFQDYDSATV